ncbi:MAG: hypothetical protein H7X80_04490 [bacterium]|nr:hypothetical protein [Candidatus Kapabacteria bacterium]
MTSQQPEIESVLLVTSTHPSGASVGANYLREAIASDSQRRYVTVIVESDVASATVSAIRPDAIVEHIELVAATSRASTLWIVLDAPVMYEVSWQLHRRITIPTMTTVWDPPELIARSAGLPEHVMLDAFERAMHSTSSCGVVSSEMQLRYRETLRVETMIVRQGVPPGDRRPATSNPHRDDRLVIGFAGTVYSRDVWDALFAALDSVHWRIGDRVVMVEMIGGAEHPFPTRRNVRHSGWVDESEVIERLSSCDVCYVPSWFDEEHRAAAQLCFPTKLSTSFASGRAVLVHAREDAASTRFVREHDCALACTSLDTHAILSALEVLATDTARYSALTRNAAAVVSTELSAERFHDAHRKLIAAAHAVTSR